MSNDDIGVDDSFSEVNKTTENIYLNIQHLLAHYPSVNFRILQGNL